MSLYNYILISITVSEMHDMLTSLRQKPTLFLLKLIFHLVIDIVSHYMMCQTACKSKN